MTLKELNEIPFSVKTGKLSLKEGKNQVWVFIFQKPYIFGLEKMDEDSFSEFLTVFSARIEKIITAFNGSSTGFGFFLGVCIQKSYKIWKYRKIKKENIENSKNELITLQYEDSIEAECEEFEKIEDSSEIIPAVPENLTEKKQMIIKKIIHIAACHSCNELQEEQIEKISAFLEISQTELKNTILHLRKKTKTKQDRKKRLIERRNMFFFHQKKFLNELLKTDPSSPAYKIIEEKFNASKKNWEKYNETIQVKCQTSPSHIQIAQSIGLKPRMVSYYLHHGLKRKELLPFIEIPEKNIKQE